MPTLKKDGAEVQIANLISYFKHFQIDIFTFDLYKEGDSIINQLDGIKIYTNHGLSTIVSLNKVINENNYKIVHSHLPKADFYVGLLKFFGNKFNGLLLKLNYPNNFIQIYLQKLLIKRIFQTLV